MFIVHVMPLARGVFKESLTYFSKEDLPAGTLVLVPVRSRTISALVVATEDAAHVKAALKSSDYALKRLESIRGADFLTPAFMHAARQTALYFAAFDGTVLQTLIPKHVLLTPPDTKRELPVTQLSETPEKPPRAEKWILQSSDEDRLSTYRSTIRESFTKGKSVFVCAPTILDIERITPHLARGIEARTFSFSSSHSAKKVSSLWKNASGTKEPILIIGTPQFLSLPRADLGTIIIERESSRAYKTLTRPYLDARVFVEYFAGAQGLRLILGDTLLRPETFYRYDRGELGTFLPPSFTVPLPKQGLMVDMRPYRAGNNTLRIISSELEEALRGELGRGGRAFVFAARKGLAPTTICNDCGNVVRCNSCAAPVVLHRGAEDTRTFVCHACGEVRPPEDLCASCGSWRFALLGVSTTRVADDLKRLFPDAHVITLEGDSAKTSAAAKKIAGAWSETKKSILVGTEMALPYLTDQIGVTAIASLDALLTLPDFRMTERILRIASYLRERAGESFIFQTRMPDHPALLHALDRSMRAFYRDELALREQFSYPPFVTLIKVTAQGKGDTPQTLRDRITPLFTEYSPHEYETSLGNMLHAHLLFKLPPLTWPNAALAEKLKSLPPAFGVKVDPEDLL